MIRNRLAELLSQRQLKISRVARDLPNLSRNTITNTASNSGKMIQLETIDTLCRYLQVTPTEFFDYIPYDFDIKADDAKVIEYSLHGDDGEGKPMTRLDIPKGGLTFTLYVTVHGTRSHYTYEYSGNLAKRLEIDGHSKLPFINIAIGLTEIVKDDHTFKKLWAGGITAGFRPIIINRLKTKIGNYVTHSLPHEINGYEENINKRKPVVFLKSDFYTDINFPDDGDYNIPQLNQFLL